MAEKTSDLTQRETQRLSRRERWTGRPLSMIERFAGEIDNVFGEFGFSRPRGLFGGGRDMWAPAVEVYQRNNESDKALENWSKVVKDFPDSEHVPEAKKRGGTAVEVDKKDTKPKDSKPEKKG